MKLNLGCGSQVPEGWINVDYALGARVYKLPFFRTLNKKIRFFDLDWDENIVICNLKKQFPWDESSVDVIYTSHTLEHFSKEEGRDFLTKCYKVLKKEGIIRVVVPHLKYIVGKFISGELRADDFVKELGVLYLPRNNPLKNKLSPFIQFPHKCMYDTQTLIDVLNEIGFVAQSKELFDSNITDIKRVELEGRTTNAVIVEGVKR